MIVLTVLSYNGKPTQGPSAQFDEIGGTIGRADANQLVLPDPERTISRVHARIVFRAGGYAVVDNGSNPIAVNGMTIGAGREHPLVPGDEIQIGAYLLGVRGGAPAVPATEAFEALFADAALPGPPGR
ncbi:MAG: FHA domain-containing protein, partial [Burkholderiales bacterium]|nr:FHA domain-containing protein [Burkholderiales bacterium]